MHSLAKPNDLARLRERLSSLQPDDQRRWGVMTAPQMLCHVRGAFRVAMGEIRTARVSLPVPPALLKVLALRAPIRWKRNFDTVPVLKLGTSAMVAGVFEQDRDQVLTEMERFVRPEQARVDHAFFGRMSYGDWMRWGYLHTDHHLRQFGR